MLGRLSDAEQRVRKRRRRDLDDEDYEEPVQPRRISARKASQVRPYILSFVRCYFQGRDRFTATSPSSTVPRIVTQDDLPYGESCGHGNSTAVKPRVAYRQGCNKPGVQSDLRMRNETTSLCIIFCAIRIVIE